MCVFLLFFLHSFILCFFLCAGRKSWMKSGSPHVGSISWPPFPFSPARAIHCRIVDWCLWVALGGGGAIYFLNVHVWFWSIFIFFHFVYLLLIKSETPSCGNLFCPSRYCLCGQQLQSSYLMSLFWKLTVILGGEQSMFFLKCVQNGFAAILWVLFHFALHSSFSWVRRYLMNCGGPEVRQMSRAPLPLLLTTNRVVVVALVGISSCGVGTDVCIYVLCSFFNVSILYVFLCMCAYILSENWGSEYDRFPVCPIPYCLLG